MATLISGLGGAAGYGENSFRLTPLSAGNLDDGSVSVNLTSVFGANGVNVFGTNYTSVFINSNGNLTFGGANTAFNPTALTAVGRPIISAFWTDIDINKGGEIYWDLDPVSGRMIITWLNVAPFNPVGGTNSFQIVLTNTGAGDLSIEYIYNNVGFTNGNGGTAVVGVSNGTTTQILAEGSGNGPFLSGYPTNDFDTNDPAGIFGFNFEGGQPFAGDGIVDGTAGDDSIGSAYVGDPGGDRIDNNDATGFAGTTGNADYVRAGAGNDTVASGLGNDNVFGGTGSDSLAGGFGGDTLQGDADNDTLDGGSGNDSLYGGDGDDTLIGGAAAAAITYTPNYVEVTTASQNVAGTNGRPNFSVQSVSNEANLTPGTNGAVSGFNLGNGDANETHTHTMSSQVSGGQILFNAVNTGETLTIVLDGVTLNLTTAVANGTVTLSGFPGTYQLNGSGQIVRAGATVTTVGTITINVPFTTVALVSAGGGASPGLFYELYVNTNPPNVAAEAGGDDQLFGGIGNDLLQGGDGNDTLVGGTGNDNLDGGTGNDTLSGEAGNDTLVGGTGNDTMSGGGDADSLLGGDDADSLSGDAGNDTLLGEAGADTLLGGAGNDSLDGGSGNDQLSGEGDDDTLLGEAGADTLLGGAGNDSLDGGIDIDSLAGDAGRDILRGGADTLADTLDGGDDQDTIFGDINDVVFGGEGGTDNDVLDLTAYGFARTNILYGGGNNESGTVEFLNAAGTAVIGTMTFSGIEKVIPCFVAGTLVETVSGPVPVESLRPGDLVLTRDHGPQPLRWTGTRRQSLADQIANPGLRPVRISAGAMGSGLPKRDVLVSPQHRLLVADPRVEMLFAELEVLAVALHLVDGATVTQPLLAEVTYVHLLFDHHEMVQSAGIWTESFQPAERMIDAMEEAQRAEIAALFPDLPVTGYVAARPTLKAHEARVLFAL